MKIIQVLEDPGQMRFSDLPLKQAFTVDTSNSIMIKIDQNRSIALADHLDIEIYNFDQDRVVEPILGKIIIEFPNLIRGVK